MKNKHTNTRTALCVFAATLSAWAHQPTPVEVSVESILSRRGDSFLRLRNNTRNSQTLTFSPGPAATAIFASTKPIVLSPNAMLDINIGVLKISDGIQVFHAASMVSVAGGGSVAGPQLYEVLEVSSTGIVKTTYERAFLSRRTAVSGPSVPLRVDIGGGYIDYEPVAKLAFPAAELNPATPYQRIDEVSTYEMAKIPLRQLPADGGSEGDLPFAAPFERPAFAFDGTYAREAAPQPQASVLGGMKGRLVVMIPGATDGAPNEFQAAHGWRVRIWQYFGGQWFQIGAATVNGDGDWSADYVLAPFPSTKARVEFQPANRFVKLQDTNSNTYTWFTEVTPSLGSVTDLNLRSVNLTKNGNAPGIDVIYQGAMSLWRKFKKYDMSALRNEPIQITYPNSLATGSCQTQINGMTAPWSCSYWSSGKIWIIPAHARVSTAQHELAHSIHSYYWNGNMPSGSGGPHNLTDCFNPGLALSEGFAVFMSYWVPFEPTDNDPVVTSVGFPIDTLAGGTFCNGQSNETRVAATFWDTYDKTNEGTAPLRDGWSWSKPWAPVSTFLKNPGHISIQDYNTVYKNILGEDKATQIVNLFLLNTMFLWP